MNTEKDFIACCNKLSDDQLDVLLKCVSSMVMERRTARQERVRREELLASRDMIRAYPLLTHAEKIYDLDSVNDRIQAIKHYRERTGLGLYESARAVDYYRFFGDE